MRYGKLDAKSVDGVTGYPALAAEENMSWLSKLLGRNQSPRWEPTEEAGVAPLPGVVARQGLANGEPAPELLAQRTVAEQSSVAKERTGRSQ